MTARCQVAMLAVSSCILRADLTLKIRTTGGDGQTTEATEYYKGNLMRRDFGTGYQVVDFSTRQSFSVDPEKKEYYPYDGAKMAMKQVVDPSHKVFIETTCAATGEQRPWFGYSAYRYLTTKKSHDEINGQSSGIRETHLDAWILDLTAPPHVWGIESPNAYILIGFGSNDGKTGGFMKVPAVQATHNGPRPHGLVVSLKSEQYESEVVALSVSPLDDGLFAVSKSFRKVTPPAFETRPLSWRDQLSLEWMRFRDWLDGLFTI